MAVYFLRCYDCQKGKGQHEQPGPSEKAFGSPLCRLHTVMMIMEMDKSKPPTVACLVPPPPVIVSESFICPDDKKGFSRMIRLNRKQRRRIDQSLKLPRREYHRYLSSPKWQEVRRRFWQSKLPKCCYVCSIKNVPFDLHHKTYRRLGRERLTDLVLLCRPCHEQVHALASCENIGIWGATRVLKRRRTSGKGVIWHPVDR